jgi:hypothetical protein
MFTDMSWLAGHEETVVATRATAQKRVRTIPTSAPVAGCCYVTMPVSFHVQSTSITCASEAWLCCKIFWYSGSAWGTLAPMPVGAPYDIYQGWQHCNRSFMPAANHNVLLHMAWGSPRMKPKVRFLNLISLMCRLLLLVLIRVLQSRAFMSCECITD